MGSQPKLESRFQTIMELAPDVVYTLSPDGTITSLSKSFERTTGWKIKDWVGKNFKEIIHPDDLEQAYKFFKIALSGKATPVFELRVISKKGSYLYGDFSSAPDVHERKIVGVIGLARDITDHKKDEEKYIHYTNLVRSADSAIISRDFNGTVMTWNRAAEELFGYKAKEIVGKNFSLLVPSTNKGEIERIDKLIMQGKRIEKYETIRVKKGGEKIDVIAQISPVRDHNGKIVAVSMFDRDNSAQKREEFADSFIAKANKLLSSSLNYNYTLRKLAKILVPELADWSAVHIINDEGKLVQLAVAHSDPEKVKWALSYQKKMAEQVNKQDDGDRLKQLMAGQSQFYPKITDEMLNRLVKKPQERKMVKWLGLTSAMTVPLVSGTKIVGSMSLVSDDKNRIYDKRDLKLAQEIGRLAGHAVDNARLYQEAQLEINKKTEKGQYQIITFSYNVTPTSSNPNEPLQFNCPCKTKLSVFVSNPFNGK